jgi:hypothetical protein
MREPACYYRPVDGMLWYGASNYSGEETMDDPNPVWNQPSVVEWSQLLLDSYRHWLGRDLMQRAGGPEEQAHALYMAPFVVISHGTQEDPILNYGSHLALTLWETTWDDLLQTPSRLTAEVVNRAEREWMLERARAQGYIDNYRGVRISNSGRRFLIENAIVWSVIDKTGRCQGQGATFLRWTFL